MEDFNALLERMVRARVAEELRKLLAQVETGEPLPARTPPRAVLSPKARPAKPITEVVRAELKRGPRTFGELWAVVARSGGGKFGLKSALNKGRERGEFAFDGAKYAEKKAGPVAPPPKKKPLPVSAGKGRVEVAEV